MTVSEWGGRLRRVLGSRGAGATAVTPRRARPECISLPPTTGRDDVRPAVRIFIGTEPGQWRAERALVWSIHEHRDPSRRYEIHRMERLAGFDERGWTTGFTNYRFAIPGFAGQTGRAIYNDVDQIYEADPAELFDLDLGHHGFLALSERELSVMLIDCERMAPVWTAPLARELDKKSLLAHTAASPGLRGELPVVWNARDGEFVPGESKLIHFTTLHTQPWRPFPERFAYRAGPGADRWFEIEARADAERFEVFSFDRPSQAVRDLADAEAPLARATKGDRQMLRMLATLTPGDRVLELEDARLRDWLVTEPSQDAPSHDGLLVPAGIEALPDTDQAWAIRRLFEASGRFLFVAASPGATTARFIERFQRVAAGYRDVHWELFVRNAADRVRHFEGGRFLGRGSPRTWVIVDERAGNETQAVGLAEALGWSYERHALRFGWLGDLHPRLRGASLMGLARSERDRLHAPWPDLVISAGRRAAPVALWIRERAQGRTRVVHLGRKGGAAARLFDLVVTPQHARLWPHPNRIETVLPLSRVDDAELGRAADRWKDTLEADPTRPRIGVLVGGETRKFRFGEAEAERLAADVSKLAESLGGRLWVTTSPRTGEAPTQALENALPADAHFFPWRSRESETPYMGLLALCDLLVVTGETESMLAEACATERPVLIAPLPRARRRVGLVGQLVDRILARASDDRPNDRGTVRPQSGLARWLGRLQGEGALRPTRDLVHLHEALIAVGRVERLHEAPSLEPTAPHREAPEVAARVRRLMGVPES